MRFAGELVGRVLEEEGCKYLVIGLDDQVPLGLKLSGQREICCLEAHVGMSTRNRFVNIDFAGFSRCLAIYWSYRQKVQKLDDEDLIQELIGQVQVDLQESDSSSLASPESYWSALLSQMRDGLL